MSDETIFRKLNLLASGSGVCPQCLKTGKWDEKVAKLKDDVENGYGVLPRHVWEKKKEEFSEIYISSRLMGGAKQMRYQYSVGITQDGVFSLRYKASCGTCGFNFQKELTEEIPLEEVVSE